MNIWIITDTHFGHENILKFCNRPKNFEGLILKRLKNNIKEDDILIHLGDVAWREEKSWNEILTAINVKRKWLIRGNHDKRSISWYLDRGWDFVGDQITLDVYGKKIVFSHVPVVDNGYDLNIHGHFHNINKRRHEPELVAIKNDKQFLIMLEHQYMPVALKSIIKNLQSVNYCTKKDYLQHNHGLG